MQQDLPLRGSDERSGSEGPDQEGEKVTQSRGDQKRPWIKKKYHTLKLKFLAKHHHCYKPHVKNLIKKKSQI